MVCEAVGVFATRVSNERRFRMKLTSAFSLQRERKAERVRVRAFLVIGTLLGKVVVFLCLCVAFYISISHYRFCILTKSGSI